MAEEVVVYQLQPELDSDDRMQHVKMHEDVRQIVSSWYPSLHQVVMVAVWVVHVEAVVVERICKRWHEGVMDEIGRIGMDSYCCCCC